MHIERVEGDPRSSRAALEALAHDVECVRDLFDEWVTTPSLRRQMQEASVMMAADG